MECHGLRVLASRCVDAMHVYAGFMPIFVETKEEGGGVVWKSK